MEAGVIIGLAELALLGTLMLYVLKNKVGKGEAEICRNTIGQRIDDHKEIEKERHDDVKHELRLVRKASAINIAKSFDKMHKIPELAKGDASMIVDALVDELNGD